MQVDYDTIKRTVISSFKKVGINSSEMLLNDDLVQKAAELAWSRLPVFPVRAAVKVTLGKDGFISLVFKIRDKLVEAGEVEVDLIGNSFIE